MRQRKSRVASLLARCVGLLALAASAVSAEDEAARIARLLGAHPGAVLADVGAGDGRWAVELAAAVGREGGVYATEVTDDLLESIRRRVATQDVSNVRVVGGDQEGSGLPVGCCDGVLLRMVYHHFVDPAAMRADLARALRAGGRLLVVETRPQSGWRKLDGVPERGGHGIEPDALVAEMADSGFRAIERHDRWQGDDDRYAVLFVATAPAAR